MAYLFKNARDPICWALAAGALLLVPGCSGTTPSKEASTVTTAEAVQAVGEAPVEEAATATTTNTSRTWTPLNTARTTNGFAWGSAFTGTLLYTVGVDSTAGTLAVQGYKYAVIQLADGSIKAWPVQSFSTADQTYVTSVDAATTYAADTTYTRTDAGRFAKGATGVNCYETEHFTFWWGNTTGTKWDTASYRTMNYAYFEKLWNFWKYVKGVTMPHAGNTTKYKINIHIFGTGLPNFADDWAYVDPSYQDLNLHPDAMLQGSTTIVHEFTHILQVCNGGMVSTLPWMNESNANWGSFQYAPIYPSTLDLYNVRSTWELSSGRFMYGSWPVQETISENSSFPTSFLIDMWKANSTYSWTAYDPVQTLMWYGSKLGIYSSTDPTADFGNTMGLAAAKMATMNFTFQQSMLDFVDQSSVSFPRYTPVEAVPDKTSVYRPYTCLYPWEYGFNIIPLTPNTTQSAMTVTFTGMPESSDSQGYRATLVLATAAGVTRYSSTLTGTGTITLTPSSTETQAYLVVAATPTVYKSLAYKGGFQNKRPYAYEFAVSGATVKYPDALSHSGVTGAAHSNGGGFVSSDSTVASTAYVGPNACVMNYSTVSGTARIEDYASVNNATVSGTAVVSNYARVQYGATISGNARVRDAAKVEGTTVTDNACIYGTARVLGTSTIGGYAVVKDTAQCFMASGGVVNGNAIIARDAEFYPNTSSAISAGRFYDMSDETYWATEIAETGNYLYANWDFAKSWSNVLADAFVSNDGILRGSPTFSTLDSKTVIGLNGTSQYVLVGKDITDSNVLTIDCNVKWNGGATGQHIWDFGTSATNNMYLTPSEGGLLKFVVNYNGTTYTVASTKVLPTSTWSILRVELTGSKATLYLNGTKVTSTTFTFTPQLLKATTNYIGRGQSSGYFSGYLDYVRVYRKVYTSFSSTSGSTPGVPPASQF